MPSSCSRRADDLHLDSAGRPSVHCHSQEPTCARSILATRDPEVRLTDDMGTFRIEVELENPGVARARQRLSGVLVDTGAELSWFPATLLESLGIRRTKQWRFRQADGSVLERWTGYIIAHVAGTETIDEVVFGEPSDMVLLGARSLEGLNLRVDPANKTLVDAGPAPAALVV